MAPIGGRPLVGQIDRLVITPDEVLVVDLKSNRQPPADVAGAPVGYLAQLAAYRALLVQLYPGRRVRAGLLWTEVPRLDEVPTALLDRHAPGRSLTLPDGETYSGTPDRVHTVASIGPRSWPCTRPPTPPSSRTS